ncbi:MAG: hypothetical protein Q7T51_04360 [Candidatus Moranbacteria bacterium]|nr:hypothetical protein [Candidatus Moranbacteria bacterium]
MGIESGPIDHKEKWIAKPPKEVIETVGSMPEALASKDLSRIQEILKNPGLWRGAMLNRENNNQNLLLLRAGFDRMFEEEFGKMDDIYYVDSGKVLDWIHKIGWPENILNEMIGLAYYTRDELRFFRLINIVFANENKFSDPSVYTRAMHDLATWQSMVEKNPNAAVETNKKVVGLAREIGDQVLEAKVGFGMTYNRVLKPKDKAIAFEKYQKVFEENGDEIEAARAMNEAADAYTSLAERQLKESKKIIDFDNLDRAEFLALESLKKSHDLGSYTNAIIRAHKVLHRIYVLQGNLQKAEKYRNEADIMEKLPRIKQK